MLTKLKAQLASLEALAAKDLSELWQAYRTPLILFGGIILYMKSRDLILSYLLNSGKRAEQSALAKDAQMQAQENKDNQQADALVQQAADLPKTEQPVGTDWNKHES